MKIVEDDRLDPEDSPLLDDPRVAAVLEEYLAALEAGQRPDRRAYVSRYPDIADALSGCLQSLEAIHSAGPRLAAPAEPAPPAPPTDLALPLGDFRIIREVGRGGMGIVYEATQLSLGRRVALKVLPFASALDQRHLQRFKNEAQAAALLHHTNIVPVFAVGCERGVYYYAMQFIEGRTVAAYVQETRRLAGAAPSSSIPMAQPVSTPVPLEDQPTVLCPLPGKTSRSSDTVPRAVLNTECSASTPEYFQTVARLGVEAAEGLEHAHQRGVIHRDVKPANLLLDEQNHLWITDFGLARCQAEAGLTGTGDLIGTLRYMSPEQALGRPALVDHRTDIYALGATLYELLTLEPVFAASDRQELLRQIAQEEPQPPRALRRSVPRELETIVLKAIGKTPEERYSTAQELADDLRRYLEDRPILARRPTLVEKSSKWLRRHRKAAMAAVVVLMFAVAGLACATVLIAREQGRTAVALKEEEKQRKLAEDNLQRARRALDYFTQVCTEDMADKPEMQVVRRKLLEAARDYYQEFIDQHQDDPNTRQELAKSHMHIAQILSEIDAPSSALASAMQARDIQEGLVRDNPASPELKKSLEKTSRELNMLRSMSRLFLLGQKSVQEELKLTEAQLAQVSDSTNLKHSPRTHGPDDWFRMADKLDKVLEETLNADQLRRLRQIDLQQTGVWALTDPEVADTLKLTPAQKEAVRKATTLNDHRGRGPDPMRMAADSVKRLGQITELFSPEQQVTWQELQGETFRGEIRRGPPPWSGGRGRPPGP
jgi:serine/threonine protein kinase